MEFRDLIKWPQFKDEGGSVATLSGSEWGDHGVFSLGVPDWQGTWKIFMVTDTNTKRITIKAGNS